ncbi:MAG: hypothetical protein IJD46_04250, partial [Bacilli bacterium]|nr:hypothetical protein [Bacilli bacterium]
MGSVGVASCSHHAWIDTSRYMGVALAKEISDKVICRVHTPIDKNGLLYILSESNYFIMHTHGSPEAFIDERADGIRKNIVSLKTLKSFPEFPNLKLVILTACSTAGGIDDNNIAKELSKHIAKDGLVIANKYDVYGGYIDFGERFDKNGWVGYQNGMLVLDETKIPARITMQEAYRIFLNFRK